MRFKSSFIAATILAAFSVPTEAMKPLKAVSISCHEGRQTFKFECKLNRARNHFMTKNGNTTYETRSIENPTQFFCEFDETNAFLIRGMVSTGAYSMKVDTFMGDSSCCMTVNLRVLGKPQYSNVAWDSRPEREQSHQLVFNLAKDCTLDKR